MKFVDLHQHCLLSANCNDLKSLGITKPQINTLSDLTKFAKTCINPLYEDINNIKLLIESNFENCLKNNTFYLSTSVDYTLCDYFENISLFVEFLKNIKSNYKNLKVFFELGISRNNFKPEHYTKIVNLIDTGFFCGLDLYGDEMIGEHKLICKIYKYAKKRNLILKAHIGEFKSGKDVKKLYKKLKLNEIQHGITIAEDSNILKYFSKKDVVFNICPTSNKVLKNIEFSKCVAKKFLDSNIKFTIASDDYLFFGASVQDEYDNLINAKVLTNAEAKKINSFSINYFKRVYINR